MMNVQNGNHGLLPPCRVCGEKASGFHYGANTCEACKVSKNWLFLSFEDMQLIRCLSWYSFM